MSHHVLFAGAGDIATRVAQLLPSDWLATGIRRDSRKLSAAFRQKFGADLRDEQQLAALALPVAPDYVVVSLTPSGRTPADYQRAYVEASSVLSRWLTALSRPPKRVFYVSSTSVYPQTDHQWIDETSSVATCGTAAQLVAAEQCWLASTIPTTVLRLSGIYGADRRYFLNHVRSGATAPIETHYSNRIHVDDAARTIAYLLDCAAHGQPLHDCYIVSDSNPAPLAEVVDWLQQALPLIPPADSQASTMMRRRGGSKRCSNRRLLSTGFALHYPSFREGYGAMLASEVGQVGLN